MAVVILGAGALIFWSGGLGLVKKVDAPKDAKSGDTQTGEVSLGDETRGDETSMADTTAAFNLADGVYELDAAKSDLRWAAERIVGNSHQGAVTIKDGRVVLASGAVAEGHFTIDMSAITESKDNQKFLGHIKSDDFFAVDKFPTAKFNLKSIQPIAGNSYAVIGDLTIRDKANEITFEATISDVPDGLRATANFAIDRTKWGINYDSGSIFQQLGDKAIRDEIQLELGLIFAME